MASRTKLLDQMRLALRRRHVRRRTEQVDVRWTRRFLTHLAIDCRIATATQNVALNALLCLYCHVLKQEFPTLAHLERAKRPRRAGTTYRHASSHDQPAL